MDARDYIDVHDGPARIVGGKRLLFIDPEIDIVAPEAPLAANLEGRNLTIARLCVGGLLGNLQKKPRPLDTISCDSQKF